MSNIKNYLAGGTYVQCPTRRIVRLEHLNVGDIVYCITKEGMIEEAKVTAVRNLGRQEMHCHVVKYKEYGAPCIVSVWCSDDKQFATQEKNAEEYELKEIEDAVDVALFDTRAKESKAVTFPEVRSLVACQIEIDHEDGMILLHNNLITSTHYVSH